MINKCLDQWSSLLLPHSRCLIHFSRCASHIWQSTVQSCCQKTSHVYSWSYAEPPSLPRERLCGNPELLHRDNTQICVAAECKFSQLRILEKEKTIFVCLGMHNIYRSDNYQGISLLFYLFNNVGFYVFNKPTHIPTP